MAVEEKTIENVTEKRESTYKYHVVPRYNWWLKKEN
jgi:hypothetical protein